MQRQKITINKLHSSPTEFSQTPQNAEEENSHKQTAKLPYSCLRLPWMRMKKQKSRFARTVASSLSTSIIMSTTISHSSLTEFSKSPTNREEGEKQQQQQQKPSGLTQDCGLTWLSTSMAMSINISCSSRIEFSSFMMSLCRASMSARVCLACCVSMMICQQPRGTVRTHRKDDLNAFHCNRANSQNTQNGWSECISL